MRGPILTAAVVFALFALIAAPVYAEPEPQRPDTRVSPQDMARDAIKRLFEALDLMLDSIPRFGPPRLNDRGDILIPRLNPPQLPPDPDQAWT